MYIFTVWPYLGQDRRQWRFYPWSITHMTSLGAQYVCRCRAGGIWMYIGDVTQLGHTVDSTYIFTLWPYLGQDRRQWRFYPLSITHMTTLGRQYVCRCRDGVHWMDIWIEEQKRSYSGLDVYFHCLTLFRPKTTPMTLLSFIEHSYDIPWAPICVPM